MTKSTAKSVRNSKKAIAAKVKDTLPIHDRRYYIAIKRELCKRSYYEFFKYFWDTIEVEKLKESFHLKLMCDELQKVGERLLKRLPAEYDLIINVPPGTSKSRIGSIFFPVWLWCRDPSIRVLSASHSGSLSVDLASNSRDVIASDKFREMFGHLFSIRRDTDAKTFYKNSKGGYRVTTSVGARIFGLHSHIIICDDLLDPKGAKSVPEMTESVDFLNKTLSSRKVDKELVPTILIMQRLHENDPTGDWLRKAKEEGKKVRHICLPATDDFDIVPGEHVTDYEGEQVPVKEIYKRQGGYLDPVRLGPAAIAKAKVDLGSRDYAGQFGQSPRMKEGDIFKSAFFQIVDRHQVPWPVFDPNRNVKKAVGDTAFTDKEENDPSAFASFVVFEGNLYILHAESFRKEFSGAVKRFSELMKRKADPNSMLYIEPKASGKSIYQFLKKHTRINVEEYKMPYDTRGKQIGKKERAHAAEPFCEAGRVFLLRGPWNQPFIDEVTGFPNLKHDEMVDLLCMMVNLAFNHGAQHRGRQTR